MNETTWAEYLRAIAGDDTGKTIATKTGQSESAISRWKSGTSNPEPRQVVIVARAYGRNPLEALIAASFLTREELDMPIETPRALMLSEFTDLELAREMLRRVDSGQHDMFTRPLDTNHPAIRQPKLRRPGTE